MLWLTGLWLNRTRQKGNTVGHNEPDDPYDVVDDPYDVVIVGMGPVGAAAANLAGRAGMRTLVVDKAVGVHPLPRAIHFDADVMRVLQSVGLADAIMPIVRPYRGGVHLGVDGEPIRDFRVEPTLGPQGWHPHYAFYQPEFEQVIRDAALADPSVSSRFETEVLTTSQHADHVEIEMRDAAGVRTTVRARYLIACDGASSRTRKSLGIKLFDYEFNEPWIIIDAFVPDAGMLEDFTVMWCDPARPGTYVPGPGRHRRWEFMLLEGETAENMTTPEAIEGLLAPVVSGTRLEVIRSAVYQFHGLIAERWRDGRILLAGDAAHQTPPFYGQGMCHGIRDVANLIWKLRIVLEHPELEALLDAYQVERQPHVKTVIDASVENGRYICMLDPDAARERDARLRARVAAGADNASFRSVIPGLVAGMLSEINSAHAERGAPMPQPRVRVAGGVSALLDDVLGAGFALLYTGEPASGADLRWFASMGWPSMLVAADQSEPRCAQADWVIEDSLGTLAEWFKENDVSAVLIRPDRYVYGVAAGEDGADRLLGDFRRQFDKLTLPPAQGEPQ
jgi:3-(3-hydroxy-phenyl)propionate hydroxylase